MAPYLERQHSSRILNSLATAISGAGTSQSPASSFGPHTYQIRLASTLPIWFQYGDGAQTAAGGAGTYLPTTWVAYLQVSPGTTLAFLSTSTSTGYVSITEMG